MIARAFVLATFVAGGIMLADLLIHPQGTKVLANAGVTVEKTATNALLGTPTK
jgi:hypothetical protein